MTTPLFEHPSVLFAEGVSDRTTEALAVVEGKSRGEESVAVRVDDAGIFVGGKCVCARDALEFVGVAVGSSVAVIVRAGPRTLTFKLEELDDARRMLVALGRELPRTRTTFLINPPLHLADMSSPRMMAQVGLTLTLALGLLGVAFFVFGVRAMALPVGLGILASLLWSTARVDVGVDGVRIHWFWLNRFYRFAELETATGDGSDGLTLALRSGERVSVQLATPEHLTAAVARVEDGIAAFALAQKATEAPAIQQRVASAQAVAELRRLGASGGEYRVAGLDRDQLWAVLEDPANDAVARANAATALSGRLDDRDRNRLRVAASATASPHVRVAIEAAAAGSTDEVLAEALAKIDDTSTS